MDVGAGAAGAGVRVWPCADLASLELRHDVLVCGDALDKAVLAFTRAIARSASDMAAAGARVWGIAVHSRHVRASGAGVGAADRPARDPVALLAVAGVERSRKAFTSLVRGAVLGNLGVAVLADAALAVHGGGARMVHVRKHFVLHFGAAGAPGSAPVWRSFGAVDLQSIAAGVFASSGEALQYARVFAGGAASLQAATTAAMCAARGVSRAARRVTRAAHVAASVTRAACAQQRGGAHCRTGRRGGGLQLSRRELHTRPRAA